MQLTRTQKLFYGFALAGCFLTVMAFDDGVQQEEMSEAHKNWIISQEAKQAEEERWYKAHPETIGDPAFAGKPDFDKQFALLRKDFEERKGLK